MSSRRAKLPPDVFTFAQARAAGLSKHEIYRRRDAGDFELVARGLYRRSDEDVWDLDLVEIGARAPRATLCLTSALVRHDLSDAIPAVIDVAIPRGTRAPRTRVPVQWHRFDPATFDIGREPLRVSDARQIAIYSAERCIIDAFRLRGTEGAEQAYDALKRWLRQRGAQPSRLLALATHFPGAATTIRKTLEILL